MSRKAGRSRPLPIHFGRPKASRARLASVDSDAPMCPEMIQSARFGEIAKQERPSKNRVLRSPEKIFKEPVDFPCFPTHIMLVSAPFRRLFKSVNG